MKKLLPILLILLALPLNSHARLKPIHPVVVELFTSEGCAACPPADDFLKQLNMNPNIIALAYHVDYWDNLGWKDSFSLKESTYRQEQYSKVLETDTFTPQIVVQGEHTASGNHREEIEDFIADAQVPSEWIEPDVKLDGNKIKLHLDATDNINTVIFLVSYQKKASAEVTRGENIGKKLEHINSVVQIEPVIKWQGDPVSLSMPKPKGDVAVLLIQDMRGKMLGAETLDLN